MGNLLQLFNGSKGFGGRILFSQGTFAINEGEHIGVIGPNGAGKTTLFKILTGEEGLDDGEIIKSRSLRMGYLAQHDQWTPTQTVEEFLEEKSITPIWELKSMARGLGLGEDIMSQPVVSLSGGYRMRCKLLSLIGQEPNLMLLDEPTNYLDLETVIVLERFLQDYNGAFLLISHDREFLRRTTDHTLEVEAGDITKYSGTIDDYFEQKAMIREQLASRALSVQQKRKEIMDFVNRFGAKATKARQAQSKLKQLKKLDPIEIKPLPIGAKVLIPEPVRTGKLILTFENVNLGYEEKTVLNNVNYILSRGDHVGVVGFNGAGKSTFLKGIAGILEPQQGAINVSMDHKVAYYAQHVSEGLIPSDTVYDSLISVAHRDVTRQEVLDLAGSLLFSGDDIKKKISVLSGGEKSRVALGQVLLKKSPCLVLDEPTNHLDFQTVEALVEALNAYAGTVVVVSHDRSFLSRMGRKILEINNGEVTVYHGTYDEYVWSLQKGSLAGREINGPANTSMAPEKPKKFNYKEKTKELRRQIKKTESEMTSLTVKIEKLQAVIKEINDEIVAGKLKRLDEMVGNQDQLHKLEESWLEASEKKDSLQQELNEIVNN